MKFFWKAPFNNRQKIYNNGNLFCVFFLSKKLRTQKMHLYLQTETIQAHKFSPIVKKFK